VTREKHLAARREYSYAIVGGWICWWQKKGRFSEVCPSGKALHLLVGQSIGIDNNSQTISLIWNGAKDIALNKAAAIHE
jgi:hypothetical protein